MLIGITGGIGSGKSVIARGLCQMGYPVYDSDSRAQMLIQTDSAIQQAIISLLGSEAFVDKVYQKEYVASIVFSYPERLEQLNRIVHPAVKEDLMAWTKEREKEGKHVCFVESAILFSSHIDEICDGVVIVKASEDVRVQRVMDRDHTSINNARMRIRAQRGEEALQKGDLVINNDGNTEIFDLCLQIRDFFCNFAV